jgi:hypothetical protein
MNIDLLRIRERNGSNISISLRDLSALIYYKELKVLGELRVSYELRREAEEVVNKYYDGKYRVDLEQQELQEICDTFRKRILTPELLQSIRSNFELKFSKLSS